MEPKYNENFQLNPRDIQVIEEALRKALESLAHHTMENLEASKQNGDGIDRSKEDKIKLINQVLGKLHNKKIFYSQTHRKKGVPLG